MTLMIDKWKIFAALANRRMTRTELCERAGISQGNMTAIFKRKRVQPITAGKIAEALGVDVKEILVLPGEEQKGEKA